MLGILPRRNGREYISEILFTLHVQIEAMRFCVASSPARKLIHSLRQQERGSLYPKA